MHLRDACVTQLGYTARTKFEPAHAMGVPVLQLRDVTERGVAAPETLLRVDLKDRVDRYAAISGDVLFRSRGEQSVAAVVDERFTEPAIAILPLVILRPNRSLVLPEYLAWCINQPAAQRHFAKGAQGTALRMVPKAALEELEIDVPDLDTQRHIVAIADLAAREAALLHDLAATRQALINLQLAERAKGKPSTTKHKERRA